MPEDWRTIETVDREIDAFSISVLNYDRNYPRDGQRLPGDVIADVEEEMRAVAVRHERLRRSLGAIILSVATALIVATLTAAWPKIVAFVGAHT